jgi:AcrR family transcriptional regulator
MKLQERRERQRQSLRKQILDAARELFTELGYEAVSMRRIAQKIGYSPTTIYLHFADKEALVRELCSGDFLQLASHFTAAGTDSDPLMRLRGIGRAYLAFAQHLPNHYRMMFMTPHPAVGVDQRQIAKDDPMVDAWAFMQAAVAEGQASGRLRADLAPEALAQLFFAGLHGVAALHIAKANDPWINWVPVEQLADLMVDTLLRGCGPKPKAEEANRAR